MSNLSRLFIALGVVAIAAGVYLWWQQHPAAPQQAVQDAPAPLAQTAPTPIAPDPAEPRVKHPVESIAPPSVPETAGDDFGTAFANRLGTDTALKFLQLTDFPRRVVATIDNLARGHAAPALWPINPTPGRFTAQPGSGGETIAEANAARYQPFVAMVQRIDTERLLALYVRFYPQLQRAYSEIGYPRGYFNDRLVEVIDNLLATPEPSGPPAVSLAEIKGTLKAERPWLYYEYADPNLESLTSGQKVLLRVGPGHRKVLKARLTEIRARVAGGALLQ